MKNVLVLLAVGALLVLAGAFLFVQHQPHAKPLMIGGMLVEFASALLLVRQWSIKRRAGETV